MPVQDAVHLEYHRPDSLQAALKLLARPAPRTVPLGGGTALAARLAGDPAAVVDLQNLGLDTVQKQGSSLQVGAAVTLAALLAQPGLPPALAQAIEHEATYNLRQQATVAGTLLASTGRSPFAIALLALDAQLSVLPVTAEWPADGSAPAVEVSLGDVLNAPAAWFPGHLVTQVALPVRAALAYEYVARSPADVPVAAVAVARWPSGRLRVVVGGFGRAPRLALDAPEPGGVAWAVQSACAGAADEWASAAYRQSAVEALARRALDALMG